MKIKLPVFVSPQGKWYACGWSGASSEDMRVNALDCHPDQDGDGSDFRLTWIEADVPMPEPQPETTIEGKVSQ